jgi:hypothetical protein
LPAVQDRKNLVKQRQAWENDSLFSSLSASAHAGGVKIAQMPSIFKPKLYRTPPVGSREHVSKCAAPVPREITVFQSEKGGQ